MIYNTIVYDDIKVVVRYSSFIAESGIDELHAVLQLESLDDSFEIQFNRLITAEKRFRDESVMNTISVVMNRYFLSDAYNQTPLMKVEGTSAISFIQQPPLNGTKIGVWLYGIRNVIVSKKDGTTIVEHNGFTHIWNLGMKTDEGDSYNQTKNLLQDYQSLLNGFDANITDNCIRTWFYVRDVDIQYAPMVIARREFFDEIGLTKNTHFIASTGICGVPDSPKSIIQMGAYAIRGLEIGQVQYIHALSHLNPTHEYGVTFERGTAIHYGDRDHVIISGTASINNKGEVVNVGDVKKQTLRMWENVEALLNESGTSFDDVMQIIVYLRDTADYEVVKKMFEERFPNIPYIITLAPVCRPKWLIEMECVAIKKIHNPSFRKF